MKKPRVLVLTHETLVPPEDASGYTMQQVDEWRTEYDVTTALRAMGHEVRVLGMGDNLAELRSVITDWKPDISFNLLEEFQGIVTYDQYVVAFLELMRQPYTGCNPRGMMISRDKALSKQILAYHRIPTAKFALLPRNRRYREPSRLKFPLFVKSATEDREIYIGVIGNERLTTFPLWELNFGTLPEVMAGIATRKVKWDRKYQLKHGIGTGPARDLPEGLAPRVAQLARRIYRALCLSGYARIDLRLKPDGSVFVLEANANPNLAQIEDLATSSLSSGVGYDELLERIMRFGLAYQAAWRQA